MATIGLYDIDFYHNHHHFSVNLFLAQTFAKLKNEGHHVIMMRPREPCGQFNNIYWFQEEVNTIPPRELTTTIDKNIYIGHGLKGYKNLSTEFDYAPNFLPYYIGHMPDKNRKKLNSIANNNLIDWRTKDLKHWKSGKTYTYIHDADFLSEPDWKDMFGEFNNNIKFIRPLYIQNYQQLNELLHYYVGATGLVMPLPHEQIDRIAEQKHITYTVSQESLDYIFLCMLYIKAKQAVHPHFLYMDTEDPMAAAMLKWYKSNSVSSFNSYTNYAFQTTRQYLLSPYRLLFSQNPQTANPQEILRILNGIT